jgi:hypothetical protein
MLFIRYIHAIYMLYPCYLYAISMLFPIKVHTISRVRFWSVHHYCFFTFFVILINLIFSAGNRYPTELGSVWIGWTKPLLRLAKQYIC